MGGNPGISPDPEKKGFSPDPEKKGLFIVGKDDLDGRDICLAGIGIDDFR